MVSGRRSPSAPSGTDRPVLELSPVVAPAPLLLPSPELRPCFVLLSRPVVVPSGALESDP